jgi:NitT/TauT family transport system ATP-binding protein
MGISHKLLSINGISKVFPDVNGSKTVLQDINLKLSIGDSMALVGPSGCGKTTLLLMIAGLLPATSGSIWVEGDTVKGPSRKIALVLQHYGLFPWKTVAANISLGARLQKISVTEEELREAKRELGIELLDHLYPEQLSGGERQRVALARAILLRPSLLLLDEPFAAIDTITRERLQNRLLALFSQRKFSFIVVTHNIEEAVFLGRRIVVLDTRTSSIKAILHNDEMGGDDYRRNPLFFDRTLELRKVLEEME